MRLLIGSPCGGGQVTTQYLLSAMETMNQSLMHKQEIAKQIIQQIPNFDNKNPQHQQALAQNLALHTFDIGFYTLAGESLIQRGRNHIAQIALTQGWDKLMFIDADAGWTWPQLHKIITSPHPITAGVCPLKIYPISLNFLPFQQDEIYFKNAERSLEGMKKMAANAGSPLVKVPFVGTAFLCIDRSVLQALAETADHYKYPNPGTGESESHWDFFKVESIKDTFLSEDWGFCHRAREAGFDVYIDTDVIITHTGNHTFRVGA